MTASELLEKARAIGALLSECGPYANATLFCSPELVVEAAQLAGLKVREQTSASLGLDPRTILAADVGPVTLQASREPTPDELARAVNYPAPVPYQPAEPEEEPGDIASRQSRIPKEYAEP